ncbi:MAG: hypothetical protein COU51_04715 [Parcubacteria group bacterium CG10_big_fil_rev_8_21_14_0_10_36_14]|nr:MAG: hypothetical protein COU51_04715 [Parcubacteria group bacterium CG10_big_fil_rev_8_21_14_0_10_36_14]
MSRYYFINPHGHVSYGVQWDGLHRENNLLSLQTVIDVARTEFSNKRFDEILLFPRSLGSFALGVSERTSDKNLKKLSQLITEMEKEFESKEYEKYYVMADEMGVVVFCEHIFT